MLHISLKKLKINKIFSIFLNSFLNCNKIFLKGFNIFSNLLKHFLKIIIILFKTYLKLLKNLLNCLCQFVYKIILSLCLLIFCCMFFPQTEIQSTPLQVS